MDKSILEVVHETAKDFHDAGVMDKVTMRKFDALCLPEIKDFSPRAIKKLRLSAKVSQTVFAMYLNVSPHTVRHWESGAKHPTGAALKLLNLIACKGIAVLA